MIDPADYLVSLTSKYILSELGSPGKSGSFFYFSRDYKYIIKTIHHAEHKLLRKILRDYYAHIDKYPNTLLSQFYGLHRVKIPYGRKIHFVVMNNLFPPHRDIHQTFDLKGSTIGRDFKEADLERNPRATLKDLNWLRRNYHFEFGPEKKQVFVDQLKRDVALLQRLKIMDYSLLVGIHDLSKGNEENLRDKTLRVFQPGGDSSEAQPNVLTRTPSKLENQRMARELRQIIKKEKPVLMEKSTSRMPDEMLEERKNFLFYSDDGGFQATHEDGEPGEEIYYLGVIDCLTHVRCSFRRGTKRFTEHKDLVWLGQTRRASLERHVEQQIPDIPHPAGSLRGPVRQIHRGPHQDQGRSRAGTAQYRPDGRIRAHGQATQLHPIAPFHRQGDPEGGKASPEDGEAGRIRGEPSRSHPHRRPDGRRRRDDPSRCGGRRREGSGRQPGRQHPLSKVERSFLFRGRDEPYLFGRNADTPPPLGGGTPTFTIHPILQPAQLGTAETWGWMMGDHWGAFSSTFFLSVRPSSSVSFLVPEYHMASRSSPQSRF